MSMPVAILAGGLATRLRPLTEHMPKSLVEVAGRPFAAHQVELLRDNGLRDIVFLLGHRGEMVHEALGDGSRFGVRLRYVFDGPQPLGTGGAIKRSLAELGERFFVIYGDSYLDCDYAAIERTFLESAKAGLMTVCRNDDRWDRSNAWYESGRIIRYDKREKLPQMQHIDYGLGAFSRVVFDRWPAGESFDLALVYQDLLARDQLAAFEVPARFFEIGSFEGLEETRALLARKGPAER